MVYSNYSPIKIIELQPSMVAYACNLTIWEAKVQGLLEPKSLRSAWATWQNSVSTKISNAWWLLGNLR